MWIDHVTVSNPSAQKSEWNKGWALPFAGGPSYSRTQAITQATDSLKISLLKKNANQCWSQRQSKGCFCFFVFLKYGARFVVHTLFCTGSKYFNHPLFNGPLMWCRLLLINKLAETKYPVAHLPDGETSQVRNKKLSVKFFFSPPIKLNTRMSHVFLFWRYSFTEATRSECWNAHIFHMKGVHG